MREFSSLSEREILALAISNEEEDGRIYADFAENIRGNYPDSAKVFDAMAQEESGHRHALLDLYGEKFGEHIPLIRRHHVRGFTTRKPIWHSSGIRIEAARETAAAMELEAYNFYQRAIGMTSDVAIRKLLGDLAAAEIAHRRTAEDLEREHLTPQKRNAEDDGARRRFILHIIQPGLVGLMDGSVSTLAPVFASAFATHQPRDAFLVGLAASIGAGISMAFAEALSDDGKLSGRGAPFVRGLVCGLMTMAGGIFHTLPFLIADFWTAIVAACLVVVIELSVISWIRWRYMDTPPITATLQVMLGGALVFICGILIGTS